MSKEDIAKVALGAPALHEVFIVSTPDCLLVRSWARSGRPGVDETAVHLGGMFRASQDLLNALGSSPRPQTITIEADHHLLLLANVTPDMIAGFVFDKTAPLGLVRVQAKQLTDHIRSSINQLQDPSAEPSLLPPQPKEGYRPPPPLSTHLPEPRPTPRSGEAATPVYGTPKVERPRPEPPEEPRFPRIPPPAVTVPLPVPEMVTPSTLPRRAFPEPAATVSSPPPSIPGLTSRPVARPRAVRLLEFYRRYAPDPQAALQRLSLRSGVALDKLEHPEELDEAQVETVAAAVRDILGQEQVGL